MMTDANRSRLYALAGIAAALAGTLAFNTITKSPAEAKGANQSIALAISHGDGLRLHLRGTIPSDQGGGTALVCTRIITTPFARVGIQCRRSIATATPQRYQIY
jgi:hypothetical protein